MPTSIEFNGKEVRIPTAKVLAVLAIICVVVVFGFMMLAIIFGLIALVLFLTLPLHFVLQLCGRRGFYVCKGTSHEWTCAGALQRR